MNDAPPMSLAAKLQRRTDTGPQPGAVSRAEQFVDDVTALRVMRHRMPLGKPEIGGMDNETIKAVHTADATLEQWAKPQDIAGELVSPIVDVAFRFPDGSLAYRVMETQRWEVWRSW